MLSHHIKELYHVINRQNAKLDNTQAIAEHAYHITNFVYKDMIKRTDGRTTRDSLGTLLPPESNFEDDPGALAEERNPEHQGLDATEDILPPLDPTTDITKEAELPPLESSSSK